MRSKYPFITGLIRQLETGLPDYVDLERMVDAPDAQAAFEVLNDTSYAKYLLEVETDNYYHALHDDWRDFREMLSQFVPDRLLLDILYLREDFNNLKLILKAHYQQEPLTEVRVTDAGSVSKEQWISYFESEQNLLTSFWTDIIQRITGKFSEEVNGQMIDRIADRMYLANYNELAQQTKNRFIMELAKAEIDIYNIKTFIRAKRLQRKSEWLSRQLVYGGNIPRAEMHGWLEMEDNELLRLFHAWLPGSIAAEIEEGFATSVPEMVERALYNWRREYLKEADYVAYGPEVVVKFFYAKIRALINIRLVMMGKLNNLPPEEIKERIKL
jgi:V/A-type H+-transporting ATPase subunit C